MRAYELMVIVDGEVDDEGVRAVVERVQTAIAAAGGEVRSTDLWGRRRFAYEINHKWEGSYFVVELVGAGGSSLDEMERALRLADDVVRHKLIRLPDHEAERRGMFAASDATAG